ncbi:MAG: phosphoribosylanthranilate isomerase, partial [Arenicellales bacterium WSBS_2016_MAG_OTU3]
MLRTRIKICGITRVEDALAACEYGADAIGFIFYPPSSRHIEIGNAAVIAKSLPAFVHKVAVVVEPEVDYLNTILKQVSISAVQFHGAETPEFCASFEVPFVKTIGVKTDTDIDA